MSPPSEPSGTNKLVEALKPARRRMRFLPWKKVKEPSPKPDDDKNRVNSSNVPSQKQESSTDVPLATRKSTKNLTVNTDDVEGSSPMRLISPRASDTTPPISTPSRRRNFWNMRKPAASPSPLPSMSADKAEQDNRAALRRNENLPEEIKQALAFTVPRAKSELEIRALLSRSPGKKEALGSHPPSDGEEDKQMGDGKRGSEKGKKNLGRRENRSTELLG